MRPILVAGLVAAALAVAVPATARAEDPETFWRGEKRLGYQLAVLGGVAAAAGGVLIHRAATACERWSRDEDNDEQHLCFGAEMGYGLLGGGLAIAGAVGVVSGLLRVHHSSVQLDLALRDRGAVGGVSIRF